MIYYTVLNVNYILHFIIFTLHSSEYYRADIYGSTAPHKLNLLSFFPVNYNYSAACFLIKNIHKAVINKSFLTSGTSL